VKLRGKRELSREGKKGKDSSERTNIKGSMPEKKVYERNWGGVLSKKNSFYLLETQKEGERE